MQTAKVTSFVFWATTIAMTNNNFNSSYPIPVIFGENITE